MRIVLVAAVVLLSASVVSAEEIHVKTASELSAAIARAVPGDSIVIPAGSTLTGSFKLPAKAGTVTIRSSGVLEDKRITPGDAAHLATLSSGSSAPVFDLTDAANWTLDGLAFQPNTFSEIIRIERGKSITLRRLLFIVPVGQEQKRFVLGNGQDITLTQSHCQGVWKAGQDSQCFAAWDGAGPYTIMDNFLEAASENVLFGGADSSSPESIPADIRIERNLLTKDLAWKGQSRMVKNLLELKAAKRVIIRDNVLERSWTEGQVGRAVLFTVRNQGGKASWSVIQDVLFERNVVRETERGFQITGYDDENGPSQQTTNIVIRDNRIQVGATAFLISHEAGRVEIYRNIVEMPQPENNVLLSLDPGTAWIPGEAKRPAQYAVASLVLAGNTAPNTIIHSATVNGEGALKLLAGAYSLTVPMTDPVPVPDPEPVPEPIPEPPPAPEPPPMPEPEADTTPPVASMTVRPVGPRFEITVTGADIAYVGFYVDGKLQNALTQPTVGETTWRTRVGMGKGQHVIRVVVEDAARNALELTRTVTR